MTATTAERQGLPVTITAGGGSARGFVIDVESVDWRTVPITRQGVDQGAGPGEQALSNESIWRRTRDDWILGAGQEYADLIEESDKLRFDESDAMDCWTRRVLSPLPTVALKRASTDVTQLMCSARVGTTDYLVVTDDVDVRYTSDPETGTPTFTAHTGVGSNTKTSLTTDGRRWWACDGADIYVGTPATVAASVFSTYNADVVGYVNGRLLAADGAELVEISAAGAATVLFTHRSTGFVWDGFAPSPGGIYAFGSVGDRTEVYVITAIDASGALDVPFVAAELPQGELVRAMSAYAGIMVIATSKGLRLGLIQGGGFLSYGPVVDEPGDVRCLEPQGEYVWFGWTRSGSINGLGRLGLARFTGELVPAFASDLAARGTVSGNVLGVATINNRRYFTISGRGVYGETTTLETTSTIDLGMFTYGIPEQKAPDSITVWCDQLPAGCSIVANVYADDSASPLFTLTMNTTGQTKETATYNGDAVPERLRVTLTITQSGATPVRVRRVTLRAAPRPFVSEMITLPLMLGSAVTQEGMQEIGQNIWTEWQLLHNLLAERARCTVVVGSHSFEARIDALEVVAGGLGGGNGLVGFDDNLQFLEGTWDVTFTTLEPAG